MTEIRFDNNRCHQYMDIIQWCTMQFGPATMRCSSAALKKSNRPWGHDIMFGNTYWMFKEDKHATLFALKWAAQ